MCWKFHFSSCRDISLYTHSLSGRRGGEAEKAVDSKPVVSVAHEWCVRNTHSTPERQCGGSMPVGEGAIPLRRAAIHRPPAPPAGDFIAPRAPSYCERALARCGASGRRAAITASAKECLPFMCACSYQQTSLFRHGQLVCVSAEEDEKVKTHHRRTLSRSVTAYPRRGEQ